ncbi:MAG: beta family protein [Bacteroidia bacterium]
MPTNLKYVPVFRARQQEIIVLNSFDFGNDIFPLIEIVKAKDRSNSNATFVEIYTKIINGINATKVFVDLPLYLKERGSMQDEVLAFSRSVISNRNTRTQYLNNLSALNPKIIPVISSYTLKTGEANTITAQTAALRPNYTSLAFRLFVPSFDVDWIEIPANATVNDYLILDLDTIPPYPSPVLRSIIAKLKTVNNIPKIVIRSAINTDIQNVGIDHGNIIYEADNSITDNYKAFSADAFGDFGGIKKDDLTAGGTISPGFIYYDAVENQYYGFKGDVKNLSEFELTIVPAIIASASTTRMTASTIPYLGVANTGWQILQNIAQGRESGKSQAKFKRIAMEHYLHCIKSKIVAGEFA